MYISQGSVATQSRCGGILNNRTIANFRQKMPVKMLKIGRHLAKIRREVGGLLFLAHHVELLTT